MALGRGPRLRRATGAIRRGSDLGALAGRRDEFGGTLLGRAWGAGASAFLATILQAVREFPAFPQEAAFGPIVDGAPASPPPAPAPAPSPDVAADRAGVASDPRPWGASADGDRRLWFLAAGSENVSAPEALLQCQVLAALKRELAPAGVPYRLVYCGHDEADKPEQNTARMQPIRATTGWWSF